MTKFKFFAAIAVLAAGVAVAGDYMSSQSLLINQTTGSTGVISAPPSGASAGISIKSPKSYLGNPVANVCRVTIELPAGNTFQDDKLPKNGQMLRGWRYSGLDPLGGSAGWQRVPSLDQSVTNAIDAGSGSGLTTSQTACAAQATCGQSTISFGPFALMPQAAMGETNVLDSPAARYFWSAENIEEDGGQSLGLSQDGGIGELIECYTQ